jgi:hypothetical protein
MKKHWFGIALAVLTVVGGSYVGAHALSSDNTEVTLTQAQEERPRMKDGPRGLKIGPRQIVHGDMVVRGREEGQFETVRVDNGVLEAVNETTLTIKEANGETVEVPTSGDTRIVRDGQTAKVTDLRKGDNVHTLRVKQEDGSFTTRHVRATSPERAEELESRRAERREQREQRRQQRQQDQAS